MAPKELNMRRTQLQLGLPGSPGDENGRDLTGSSSSSSSQQQPGFQKWQACVWSQQRCWEAPTKPQIVDDPPYLQQQQDAIEKSSVEDVAPSRNPVGWPPVQSFRKNTLATPSSKSTTPDVNSNASPLPALAETAAAATALPPVTSSLFVKVYMDGVPIGRKVNLRTHSGYDKLSISLEEMFRRFINGEVRESSAASSSKIECKKFNFIYGSDYVLTYEDKDGDLMLVGDVPWGMFLGTVKRLRIMKGSEAIGCLGEVVKDSVKSLIIFPIPASKGQGVPTAVAVDVN